MDFLPLVAAVALVAVLIDIARSLRARDWNGVITPLAAMAAGTLVAWVVGESDFGADVPLGDTGHTFGSVNGFSLVLVGFALGAVASKSVDALKAVDQGDSQKRPPLIPPSE